MLISRPGPPRRPAGLKLSFPPALRRSSPWPARPGRNPASARRSAASVRYSPQRNHRRLAPGPDVWLTIICRNARPSGLSPGTGHRAAPPGRSTTCPPARCARCPAGAGRRAPCVADLYNPATGTGAFDGVAGPSATRNYSATLLNNGQVLFPGGENGTYPAKERSPRPRRCSIRPPAPSPPPAA